LCLPIPSEETQRIPSVTVFPMRKEKKASREEEELVCVVEWQAEQGSEDRKWLFVKRPERGERLWLRGATGRIVLTRLGLLAGLFEPPTIALPAPTTEDQRLVTSLDLLDILDLPPGEIVYHINDHREIGKIQHIFSHINMTYHIHHVVLAPTQGALEAAAAGTRDRPPTPLQRDGRLAVWLDRERVEHTNIGTGVKKVWAEIYGSWGNFTPREKGKTKLVERKSKPKSKRSAGAAKMEADAKNGIRGEQQAESHSEGPVRLASSIRNCAVSAQARFDDFTSKCASRLGNPPPLTSSSPERCGVAHAYLTFIEACHVTTTATSDSTIDSSQRGKLTHTTYPLCGFVLLYLGSRADTMFISRHSSSWRWCSCRYTRYRRQTASRTVRLIEPLMGKYPQTLTGMSSRERSGGASPRYP
jgi:hypothetical protein